MNRVLIDGHYGAVSLNINAMLSGRNDLEVIHLEDRTRFTEDQRLNLLNTADIVILCQSPKTVTETMPLIENNATKVLDTSNAYRLSPQWAYGLPELSPDHRKKIAQSRYVALPNPIATGAALLVMPLLKAKVMPPFHTLMINSVIGYTNGGSNMISMYESSSRPYGYSSARMYALEQTMMLQKELMHAVGLSYKPAISPIIDDYPSGALVTVPLHLRALAKRLHSRQVWDYMARAYEHEPLIEVMDFDSSINDLDGFLEANGMAGSNKMQIFVFGDNDICLLAARYDNLGKGGAGAAIQCMNLMLGLDELTGVL